MALTTNIRLDLSGFLGTNALAYYENSKTTDVKSFLNIGPCGLYFKCCTIVIYNHKGMFQFAALQKSVNYGRNFFIGLAPVSIQY